MQADGTSGITQPRVIVFYHIAALNNWRELTTAASCVRQVVSDQLCKVVFSGLYVRMHAAFVTCCGLTQEDADACAGLVASFGAKFGVTTQCTLKDKQFERVTLGRIKNNTLDGDLILYFHSKGVSTKNQGARHESVFHWRLVMEFFLIKHWDRCIELLATCEAVGLDFTSYHIKSSHQHMRHFSGNFWWTTAAYYRTLPDVIAIDDYVAPENHLLQRAQRIAELWTTGFKGMSHYGMTYPMARYIDVDADSFDKSLRIHISTRRWNQTGSNATLTP